MSEEELATRQQIRKLYAVVRNSGLEPREYMKKLIEERGVASLNKVKRGEMSELIDTFETPNSNSTPNSTSTSNSGLPQNSPPSGENEVVEVSEASEEDKERLNEIDALFKKCLMKAANLVSIRLPSAEHEKAKMIVDIAKLYFEEYQRRASMEEVRKARNGGKRR